MLFRSLRASERLWRLIGSGGPLHPNPLLHPRARVFWCAWLLLPSALLRRESLKSGPDPQGPLGCSQLARNAWQIAQLSPSMRARRARLDPHIPASITVHVDRDRVHVDRDRVHVDRDRSMSHRDQECRPDRQRSETIEASQPAIHARRCLAGLRAQRIPGIPCSAI